MKKITFLTLVMILGMSSVSFGKPYICISDVVAGIDTLGVKKIDEVGKFLVKTNQLHWSSGGYILSVKEIGLKNPLCKNNKKPIKEHSYILSCNKTTTFGNVEVEFNLNLKNLNYIEFQLFKSRFDRITTPYYLMYLGECEEIKL